MALACEQITADVIEANEFPRLAQAYAVMNVPKTVINDRVEIVGAVPERHSSAKSCAPCRPTRRLLRPHRP